MRPTRHVTKFLCAIAGGLLALGAAASVVTATAPCGDFGECKVLIEINASDGDIGFHFLVDGDDLISVRLVDPSGFQVFLDRAKGPLRRQKLTETFAESAEPLCWADPEADPEEEIVTLEQFLERWAAGTYVFRGKGRRGERLVGETQLTYELPAAPRDVDFDGSRITWAPGNDLGRCGSSPELNILVAAGVLPLHPENVPVAAWEVVLEPDVPAGDPTGKLRFTIRVPGSLREVTVPAEYLVALPDNTPVKIEVGAIGIGDNATFTEVDGFCVNEVGGGCE